MGRIVALLTLAVAAACRSGEPQQPEPAATAIEVAVGAQPVDVAAGDLDGDGRLDLVSADGNAGTLSIRLQRDGRWEPAPGDPITVAVAPHLVAPGDLDGDGDLDLLATGHDTDGVHAWLGDGAGGYTAAPGSPFAAVGAAQPHNHGLVAGDLDGDGDADVVTADQTAPAAAVLLADGRGGLVAAPGSPIGLADQAYPPALGDVDGDRHLDLVVPIIGDAAVEVLLGDGRGGFRAGPGSPHRTTLARPYAVILGDLDGDGGLDIVAPHDDADQVTVLLGDGAGGFRAGPGSPVSLGRRIWRGELADVDGDGHVDLVAAGSGALLLAPGDGRGGLGAPRLLDAVSGWAAIARDLDGDGRPDLIATDPDAGALRVLLGRDRR